MGSLAHFTYLRAGQVLIAATAVFVAAVALSLGIFDRVKPFDISDPNSEVVRASRAFESITGRTAEPNVVLLVNSPTDAGPGNEPAVAARALRSVPGIAKVTSPGSRTVLTSADGSESLVLGYLDEGLGRVEVGEAVDERFASWPEVLTGGTAVAAYQVGVGAEDDTRRLELYAAPVLLLLLLFVFRGLVAAMLPLVVATFSILLTFAVLRLITEIGTIDLFALQTVTGLGTGLAIDYSLFILTRYREELRTGATFAAAHATALRTAGRTVAFSSITVASALAALIAFPQPFLHSTGIAGALTALFAGLTALVVLPAILGILGASVNRSSIRGEQTMSQDGMAGDFWERLPRLVCRWPGSTIVVAGGVMLALASQAINMELKTPDASELPRDASSRIVAESLGQFEDLSPTLLFAVVPAAGAQDEPLNAQLAAISGVASVSRPTQLDASFDALFLTATPNPLSQAGQDLVSAVRSKLPPGSLLGGRAAEQVDQRASIFDHAPLVIAIVLITNLLILVAMTGSVLLPLLAVLMNLLTVAASLGALVAVFTTEWTANLVGAEVQTGIDMSVPVIAFAVGFGLSTDYGIFLFARIREQRANASSEVDAIVEGVAATGRLISASAILLAIAVGAFIFSDLVIVKEFAVAIAVAVLLDATVVRGLLIPAILRILGRHAWRGPGQLIRSE